MSQHPFSRRRFLTSTSGAVFAAAFLPAAARGANERVNVGFRHRPIERKPLFRSEDLETLAAVS